MDFNVLRPCFGLMVGLVFALGFVHRAQAEADPTVSQGPPSVKISPSSASSKGKVERKKRAQTPKQRALRKKKRSREVSTYVNLPERKEKYVGLRGGVIGSWAGVSYNSTLSQGLGWTGAVVYTQQLTPRVEVSAWGGFSKFRLKRSLELGAGANLVEPLATEITQVRQYLCLGATFGAIISQSQIGNQRGRIRWSVHGGFEYNHALKALQTLGESEPREVSSKDALGLVLLGPQGIAQLGESIYMMGDLKAFYSLGATGGNKHFGARFALALLVGL